MMMTMIGVALELPAETASALRLISQKIGIIFQI